MPLHPDFQQLKERHQAAKDAALEGAERTRLEIDVARDALPPPPPGPVPGTASMVLGILAVVFWWVPVVGLALAVPAVALSVPGIRRQPKDGQSVAGLVTGIIGLVGALFMTGLFVVGFVSGVLGALQTLDGVY